MKGKYKYRKVEGNTRNPIQFNFKEDNLEIIEIENNNILDRNISQQTLISSSSSSSNSSSNISGNISGNSSLFSSVINLSNTILGSGMLGLPYAYSHAGWLFGTILLILSALVMSFTLHLLSCCALKYNLPTSFSKVGSSIHSLFSIFIDLAVAIKCFGVATSYLIVIGDLMPYVFQGITSSTSTSTSILEDRRFWMAMLFFFIIVPLSFLKKLDSLKFTSILSIIFVIFLTLLVLFYSFKLQPSSSSSSSSSSSTDIQVATFDSSTIKVFPIFIFSFSCHQNIFGITNELKDVSIFRMNKVILISIIFSVSIYIVVASCGYSTFGSDIQSNILTNYPLNVLTRISRLFVSLLVTFSYPLQIHPGRNCLLTLTSSIYKSDSFNLFFNKSSTSLTTRILTEPQKNKCWLIITIIFLLLSFILAVTVKDLGFILSLVGATGSTMIALILPGFIYYYHFKDTSYSFLSQLKLNCSFLIGMLGVVIAPMCVTIILLHS